MSVDFIIEDPAEDTERRNSIHLGREFAPICNGALVAAFADRIPVELEGCTPKGERLKRTVQVCGPAAFVVLKAYAFQNRGLPKDAFDLFYMIRNYGGAGPADVAARWHLVRDLGCSVGALSILREDFSSDVSVGPKRVAEFLEQPDDEDLASDVVGFVGRFVDLVSAPDAHTRGGHPRRRP